MYKVLLLSICIFNMCLAQPIKAFSADGLIKVTKNNLQKMKDSKLEGEPRAVLSEYYKKIINKFLLFTNFVIKNSRNKLINSFGKTQILGTRFENKYGRANNNFNPNTDVQASSGNAADNSGVSNKIKIAATIALSGFGLYKVWSYIKSVNKVKTHQKSILNAFKKSLTKVQTQKSGINLDKLIKDIKQNPSAILNDKLLDVLSPDQLEMAMAIAS